jgi:hypothetical protein
MQPCAPSSTSRTALELEFLACAPREWDARGQPQGVHATRALQAQKICSPRVRGTTDCHISESTRQIRNRRLGMIFGLALQSRDQCLTSLISWTSSGREPSDKEYRPSQQSNSWRRKARKALLLQSLKQWRNLLWCAKRWFKITNSW